MTYVRCTCPLGVHWGRYGAAGLLIVDGSRVLLQRRSRHVHHGGTYSIPGGALNRGESTTTAALREAREECRIEPGDVIVTGQHADTCNGGWWTYTTVIGRPARTLDLRRSWEGRTAWQHLDDVPHLRLHPAFAATWPALRPLLKD